MLCLKAIVHTYFYYHDTISNVPIIIIKIHFYWYMYGSTVFNVCKSDCL